MVVIGIYGAPVPGYHLPDIGSWNGNRSLITDADMWIIYFEYCTIDVVEIGLCIGPVTPQDI
ncbi:hypothetical protein D3C87_1828910 [compost metagenome]